MCAELMWLRIETSSATGEEESGTSGSTKCGSSWNTWNLLYPWSPLITVSYKTLNVLTFRVFVNATLCSYHSFWERTFVTVAPLYRRTWHHIREGADLGVWHNVHLKSGPGSFEFITNKFRMLKKNVKKKFRPSAYHKGMWEGGTKVWLHPFLTSALRRRVVVFTHRPLCRREIKSCYSWNKG
jgi:hypothetical protein